MSKTLELLSLARTCDALKNAFLDLTIASDTLEDLDGEVQALTEVDTMMEKLDAISERLESRAQTLLDEIENSDRCPSCPGTEGGCCK